ncbi:LPS export ABC transporter periplasmic protein LptC [Actibacterium sp. D379-3]
MAAHDNAYSRFIALAKIILPLAALVLLSTLFMFSRQSDPNRSLPYSRVAVEQLAREQRINAPNYASVTDDGTAILIAAESARPDPANPDRADATTLNAKLDFADGTHTDIVSATGMIDTGAAQAVLEGAVEITTSGGYVITAERLTTALDRTDILAEGGVTATSPMGDVTAGQMQIEQPASGTDNAKGGHVLVFKQGVKLIYEPGK